MTRFTLWRLDRSKVRVRHVTGRLSPAIGQCYDAQRQGEADQHDEDADQRHEDEGDTA
jgi:hypothetical protein